MLSDFHNVLGRLDGLRLVGDKEAMALCPAHDDKNPSLSIKAEDDKLLLKCFAGCTTEEVVAALGLELRDLFADNGADNVVPLFGRSRKSASFTPPDRIETVKHSPGTPGLTLNGYAVAKHLPIEFLHGVGVTEGKWQGSPTVKMPYVDEDGQVLAVRSRISLAGDKFRWRSGDKPSLYGLPFLREARDQGYVIVVEGESDCHTLWLFDWPAIGVPGASNWRDEWATYFEGIPAIYVVVEPDEAGEGLWERLAGSELRDRLHRVELKGVKDVSELHVQSSGKEFHSRLTDVLTEAVPWTEMQEAENYRRSREAWEKCEELAGDTGILGRFAGELQLSGFAGEVRTAKVIYLAMVSRLLDKPVSLAIKGPSSGGKSYVVEQALRFFPESGYHALTAMSEHALAYGEEPLSHRMLVIFEAAGMTGDFQSYLIRSLLSEGRLRYETVVKGDNGLEVKLIEREGPTGLIVTTTAPRLHPENETRLISLSVTDTQEQTRDVLASLARESVEEPDLEPWLALQTWLESAENRVTIPYARDLARMVPPVAVRLRRDFGAVLHMIRAHAVLHQATRERDDRGMIVASPEDYSKVRELVADLVSEGVGATVPPIVRETVAAVARLLARGDEHSVTSREVGEELELEKGTVSRRVRLALDAGYLKNLEDRRGRPAQLVLGDDMPEDLRILPTAEDLERECFSVSSASGGI